MEPLIQKKAQGLYCAAGDFFVDPWLPVDRALITHAHGDHARWGSKYYLGAQRGRALLQHRMGPQAVVEGIAYGEKRRINDVTVSFHPAGHLLGSAQIRIEQEGRVWVVSGDYKVEPDRTCDPFEPVRCHTFLSESTFALPIYRWMPQSTVFDQINAWWRANQAAGKTSILFAYALGKAQRLLAGVDASIGPILVHGAVSALDKHYEAEGISLPKTFSADVANAKTHAGRALVIAPPSVRTSPWIRKFQPFSTAFASGWMQVRGQRRRRALDRGFVLSDHADWQGLLQAVELTGAEEVGVMHGTTHTLARFLAEKGLKTFELETRFEEGPDDDDHFPVDDNNPVADAETPA